MFQMALGRCIDMVAEHVMFHVPLPKLSWANGFGSL